MTPTPLPAPNDRHWENALEPIWQDMSARDQDHPDAELLAAYGEGNLPEAEQAACEEHLSRCPACLEIVRQVWTNAQASALAAPTRLRLRWRLLPGFLLAASVLVAVLGLSWGLRESRHAQQRAQELAQLEARLADAQIQLAAVHKENFLTLAPSALRSYWSGTTTARTLQLPLARGTGPITPEARAQLAEAKRGLAPLVNDPRFRGQALLELAALDIAARQLVEADARLRQVGELSGDSPELSNLRAVWYLAKGDKESSRKAEEILRRLTQEHPDYLPGWYNFALLLQQGFRDDESRQAWHDYLEREQRPEYRKAAEEHLAGLGRKK